jgi:uncharacterized protein (TIGR02246 family)
MRALPSGQILVVAVAMAFACATVATGRLAAQQPSAAAAAITVIVPPDAEVFIDGVPTKVKGASRLFVSPPLEVGTRFVYEIRARWRENGRTVDQTRQLSVTAGASARLDFLQPQEQRAETKSPGSPARSQSSRYPPAPASASQREHAEDEIIILKQAESFVDAFHKGDARALAAHWALDGDYITQTGTHLKGRAAIEKAFEGLFAENKGLKLRIDIGMLRFVTPDVAVEDGTTSVIPPDGAPPSRATYRLVHTRRDGQWHVSSVREAPFTPPNNREHLAGLDWLVGSWAENNDKGEVARVTFSWADNQNFLVSEFATTVKQIALAGGTQRIGWDPEAKQIRSWTFESNGGFGEGRWSRDGNTWTIKTEATLPDGKRLAVTNVMTRVDADTMTFQSHNRTLDGRLLPEVPMITLKRAN